jgi:uncharacterized membrane protein
MKNIVTSVAISTVTLLLLSVGMLYLSITFFPALSEEYFSPVFRSAGSTDWMYYAHPLVLSIALKWFWERYKTSFAGNILLKAAEVAAVYCVVAMIPVLWLTFSAIDVSFKMILTWLLYGFIQAFVAGIIFAKLNP